MSTPESSLKTLAIRLKPEVHAQLSFIAQLRGQTINDEGLLAVTGHIAQAKTDPVLLAKADQARQEIERDATVRRDAIASMFDTGSTAESGDTARPARSRRPQKGDDTTPS
ncbi:hypothetical protein HQ314_04885 [Rhodococcus sp. BP-332]|uniref:hypothetical protein n=1 Tax=Rhodococcus sp. BP-332 TaxID=2739447 RepID=UPI001C9AB5C4|nr:hypothetical protein [Rhodococcus sp. BP-332]MBY6676250.1 hypothetical protein [Rhodococcus sp. BP-332]